MKNVMNTVNHEIAQVCQQVRASVVQINNGRRGVGSGVIWSLDGLIVTNAHVIMADRSLVSDSLSVTLHDGRSLPAQVLAHDSHLDIAAIAVSATELSVMSRGNSRQITPGDWVTAMGFPWGVPGGVTSGIVIGLGMDLPELSQTQRDWIAATVRLRPGHSGGPLFNSQGQLIGINTIMTGPNVGGAVPLHVVDEFLQRMNASQPRFTERSSGVVNV